MPASTVCTSCSTALSDDGYAGCDNCDSTLCSPCSKLTATEMRAVALRKRTIVYLCPNCKIKGMPSFSNTQVNCIKALINDLLKDALLGMVVPNSGDSDDVLTRLDRLSEDVRNLKDSNIDLIRLCTGVGAPVRWSLCEMVLLI